VTMERYRSTGDVSDLESALAMYERALATLEATLGPEHPQVAGILSNLAGVTMERYRSTGDVSDLESALAMYERALATLEATLGPEDPQVALMRSNVAMVHQEMGDPERAKELYEESRRSLAYVLGDQHDDTRSVEQGLATASLAASTVTVFGDDAPKGSGFCVGNSHTVITALRNVDSAPELHANVNIMAGNGDTGEGSLLHADQVHGVMVLHTDLTLPQLALGSSHQLTAGMAVRSFRGPSPLGFAAWLTGSVIGRDDEGRLMTQMQSVEGLTGAPVIDPKGLVIGMVQGSSQAGVVKVAPVEWISQVVRLTL
jgi:uncharacterized coiled-coil protein SlyX